MPPVSSAHTELLAPAGGLESFFAAIEAGADAVYCGLNEFSARAKAKNFTLAEVERLTALCHQQDRKLYVALNTLIKEAELPRLIEVLAALEAMDSDGVILQDLAVWRLARRHFPGLPLHASTQMTVHNPAGVRMLERLGFARAVLARELSLAEIAAIRRETTIELEHFVHGALCFAVSGQCLFSSFLAGKSGNRGRCAQPCRRRYFYRRQPGYYFSTNDLCAIELLPRLIEAGVMSFKIEGRMKSAEYVGRVVAAYRRVLDAPAKGRKEALAEAAELLELSFGRPPTKGFLTGFVPTNIASGSRQGTIGTLLGEIDAVRGNAIHFTSAGRLHLGDRLRVLPKNDQAGSGFTVTELRQGKKKVKAVKEGEAVSVPFPGKSPFRPGDAVYRVGAERAFAMSEEACRRKLQAVRPAPIPVRLAVSVTADRLELVAEAAGVRLVEGYGVETFVATDRPLTPETLRRAFAKSGETPFALAAFTAEGLPPVVIPPSRLKEIRRDCYQRLAELVAGARAEEQNRRRNQALAELLPAQPPRAVAAPRVAVMAADSASGAAALDDPLVAECILPLTPANVRELARQGKALAGRGERVVWDVPALIFPDEWQEFRAVVGRLAGQGFQNFRLNNLGHFELFREIHGARLVAGPRLYTLNSQAALVWRELGAAALTLSLEDDRENLRAVLARATGLPATITVYGEVELFLSRIPIRGVRSGDLLHGDQGEAYRVASESGLTVVTAGVDFSLTGRCAELAAMGCDRWLVDCRRCGISSPRGRAVLAAVRDDRELPDTSRFNFERGLE